MGRKVRGVLPEGEDVAVAAVEVRAGMWMLDPETGEWGNVKQAGIGNACVGFGGVRTWRVSLRKLGAREFASDEQVTVRVPAAVRAQRTDDGGGASPIGFTPDVLERAMAVPSRAPHVFPEGPSARLVERS